MIKKAPTPTPEAPEFTTFTRQQRYVLTLLFEKAKAHEQYKSNSPAESRYLSEDFIPADSDINILIDWGLVTTGEADYIGKQNGYALTDEGEKIALHIAGEIDVPSYARAGYDAALVTGMNNIIKSVRERREKDARTVEEYKRNIKTFKGVLENIGVKDASPTDFFYTHEQRIRFEIKGITYYNSNRQNQSSVDYTRVKFDLFVQRVMTPEEQPLWDEMNNCNSKMHGGKILANSFINQHRFFNHYIMKYPLAITINTGDYYKYLSLNDGLWVEQAKAFAAFVLEMDDNWEVLQIEWAHYQSAYEGWQAEQDRLEQEQAALLQMQREAEEAAALDDETSADDEPAAEQKPNPNEAWLKTTSWLKDLIVSVEKGYRLDATDLWVLGTVQVARRLDSDRYDIED